MLNVNQTLGQLATTHPAAVQVFLRHQLDFCCGGGKTLADACHDAGLDPETVIAEITAEGTAPEAERWDTKALPDLIGFILTRYHEPLRRDLRALIDAAKKVERVHADKPTCPQGLAAYLERATAEIEQHLAKEEQVLFPAIESGGQGAEVEMPIRVLMAEHDDHRATLQRLRELTTEFIPPPEACPTWRGLYAGLEKLESELMEHIHLENNILFPRALKSDDPKLNNQTDRRPPQTDILKHVKVTVECGQCGTFTVSGDVIAESQRLLDEGCPGSSCECPPQLFASLLDPSTLKSLVQAWEAVEHNAQRLGGRASVKTPLHTTVRLEEPDGIARWEEDGGRTSTARAGGCVTTLLQSTSKSGEAEPNSCCNGHQELRCIEHHLRTHMRGDAKINQQSKGREVDRG